jgi:uncharacterized protein (TIGR03084 family)
MGDDVTTLQEVLADLREETAALDRVLATLDEAGWHKETPAVGWDTHDTIAHLADTNDVMYASVTGTGPDLASAALDAVREAQGNFDITDPRAVDVFTARQVERGRQKSWQDVYAWWQSSAARLHDLLAGLDPKGRYLWGANMISPLSLCSARLMETWAHSLDVHAAAGVEYVDTDRIRHVAFLGLRAMPNAFMLEKLGAPGPIRIELKAPSGDVWTMGPDDAPTVIRGTASDWARLVARRDRDGSAERLEGEGPDAANVIKHARAFL